MSATYSLTPTYYQVTVNFSSPTNYTGLSGSQAGTVDSTPAANYNKRVSVTGNVSVSSPGITAGNSLVINNQTITFPTTTTNATVITNLINLYSKDTAVIASQGVGTNYITLCNAPSYEGSPFSIADGSSPSLAQLGITAGKYCYPTYAYGTSFSPAVAGSNIVINGTNLAFTTATGSNVSNVTAAINTLTLYHGVQALPAGGNIQLNGVNSMPINLGSTGNATTALGFTATNYGGQPSTLAASINKEQANMRWSMIINNLELFGSPTIIGDVVKTGNFDGSNELTQLQFTVGFNHPDQIYTIEQVGEPNPGATLVAEAAIQRMVARALVQSYNQNREVFDPTLTQISTYATRMNPLRIINMTTTGIDTLTNIATVQGNITVTRVANV